MEHNTPLISPQRDIAVFQSLAEIPYITFPTRLDYMLLVVCTGGCITSTIDIKTHTISANDILVLRPGHRITQCELSPDFTGFFITVAQDKIDEMFPSMRYMVPHSLQLISNPIIHVTDNELESLKSIYDLFIAQLSCPDRPYNSMALAALCEVLFFSTLGIYTSRIKAPDHKSRREELLSKFIELLEENYMRERTVSYYADRLYVTPKHLSAVLKEVSEKTAGEWIDQRVIVEAKMLLRSTGLNIQEISAKLNFANQSFFGKYFKHLTGMSPRDYRSKLSDL
ncbi:MAG: helix-turn-helix domain-containing protein [Duncaniella sp.]|nr:helix-turn-helix domain-containing protein [Duncaniella sp.]